MLRSIGGTPNYGTRQHVYKVIFYTYRYFIGSFVIYIGYGGCVYVLFCQIPATRWETR
jgi:hypothetical protein